MDSIRSGPFGEVFRPDNFVFGNLILSVYESIHVEQNYIFEWSMNFITYGD